MKLTAPSPVEDLNMLVATRVFELDEQPWSDKVCCPYCGNRGRYCGQRSWCDRCTEWYSSAYKYYDSNIEDAMLVVEKMRERGFAVQLGDIDDNYSGKWRAWFDNGKGSGASCKDTSLPRAICLAALSATQENK